MAQGRSTKIISMIKSIRTSRLSIKNSLSLWRSNPSGKCSQARLTRSKVTSAMRNGSTSSLMCKVRCWRCFLGSKIAISLILSRPRIDALSSSNRCGFRGRILRPSRYTVVIVTDGMAGGESAWAKRCIAGERLLSTPKRRHVCSPEDFSWGTSLTRKRYPPGPYRRPASRALRCPWGGVLFYERDTPVFAGRICSKSVSSSGF